MFTKVHKISAFLVLGLVLSLSACNIGAQTPSPANTPEITSTSTSSPTMTRVGISALTTEVVATATDIPTALPSVTPTSVFTTYSSNEVRGPFFSWTLWNLDGETVIAGPGYRFVTPEVTVDKPLTVFRLRADEDVSDVWAAVADLFPDDQIYYAPLEISGSLPGTVKRGLPNGWEYFTTPLGTWTNLTESHLDWWDADFVSLKGLLLEAEKSKTQPAIIQLEADQFGTFMLTCEKGSQYPNIRSEKRSVFQVFVTPRAEFNFSKLCSAGMVNGSGYIFSSTKGDNNAEREEWVITMANAYLELMFSKQDLNGKLSNQIYLDNEKGGASNFARLWIGDQRFAPPGFTPPTLPLITP